MTADNDADLRDRFRSLRTGDDAAAPAFAGVLTRAPVRVRDGAPRLAWTAGGLVLAAVAAFFLALRPHETAPEVAAFALAPWPTQTDSLMASAGDSSRLTWSPSRTSGLGQPSFNRYRETR